MTISSGIRDLSSSRERLETVEVAMVFDWHEDAVEMIRA